MELDPAVDHRAAGPAAAFEVLAQRFQKRGVARKTVDNRNGFPAAAFLFHAQLRDDARWNRLVSLPAALTIVFRPAAARADSAGLGGIDGARVVSIAHAYVMLPA